MLPLFLFVAFVGALFLAGALLNRLVMPILFAMANARKERMGLFHPLKGYEGETAQQTQRIFYKVGLYAGLLCIISGVSGALIASRFAR